MAVLGEAKRASIPWAVVLPVTMATAIAVFAMWSIYTMMVVEKAARETAGTQAYCIQTTASQFDYRPVERHTDLLGFNLLVPETNAGGSEGYKFTFHAVLTVLSDGRIDLYDWSHRAQAFMPITADARRLIPVSSVCNPIPDFIDTL